MNVCKNSTGEHFWRNGRDFLYCVDCGVLWNEPQAKKKHRKAKTAGPSMRWRLLARDGPNCRYCGRECFITDEQNRMDELTVDHVVPRSKGGGNNLDNCVIACRECNAKKGDKHPHEFVVTPAGKRRPVVFTDRGPYHTRLHTRADGQPKRAYPDLESALDAAEFLAERDRHCMEAFECFDCGDYHIRIVPGYWRMLAKQAARSWTITDDLEFGARVLAHVKAENVGRGRRHRITARWKSVARIRKRDAA